MSISDEAVEAAWSELARGMGCDPEDRGAFESQLLDALTSALNAAAPHLMVDAWDEGVVHKVEYLWPEDYAATRIVLRGPGNEGRLV